MNSTKKKEPSPAVPPPEDTDKEQLKDSFPKQPQGSEQGTRTHDCFITCLEQKLLLSVDPTGRFPIPSATGNNYIYIAYDYDSNSILMEPFQNREAKLLLEAYKSINKTLTAGGRRPKYQRLDNECPQILIDYFQEEKNQLPTNPAKQPPPQPS